MKESTKIGKIQNTFLIVDEEAKAFATSNKQESVNRAFVPQLRTKENTIKRRKQTNCGKGSLPLPQLLVEKKVAIILNKSSSNQAKFRT